MLYSCKFRFPSTKVLITGISILMSLISTFLKTYDHTILGFKAKHYGLIKDSFREKLSDIDLLGTSYKADGLLFVGAWSLPTQTEVKFIF